MYRVFVFLFLLLSVPCISHGQFNTDIMGDSLTIVTDPQYPSPGETVIASIDDYSLNTTGAILTWYRNGIQIGNQNERSFTFTAPELGSTDVIAATLKMPAGPMLSVKKSITPAYFDLIIEPETYTPPFYEGRALPTKDSLVRATVLIHDKNGLVNPNLYSYTWTLNDTVLNGGGRTGGNQTTYTVPYGSSHIITVAVYSSNGQVVAERSVEVPSSHVDVKLYEVSPLYGLSHRVVTSPLQMIGNSLTLRAVAYNMDLGAYAQNLFTQWSINNQAKKTDANDPFEITLGRQGAGSANVGFKVRNLNALLQGDETATVIQF